MLFPIGIVFTALTAIFLIGKSWFEANGLDVGLLVGGNFFLCILCLVSFLFLRRSVVTASPNVFIRNFYLSFLVKFLLVAITVLVYAKTQQSVNRMSVIICMALYMVYTFIEVRIILKESKKQNAK